MVSPAPGIRVGPYELLEAIGAGGMGEVWRARDVRLHRSVAIKFSRQQFSQRFEGEARAIAAFSHPHICQLYDVGPDYLVMEFIDGHPVGGPLPLHKATLYAGQILDALEAAHRKGIIHRDLKPGNILLTRQGIKLLDFGIAKRTVSGGESSVEQTVTIPIDGQIVGTLSYMAPEQLQGKDADARSDIFSFGCVFYEMLSGRRAFQGESGSRVAAAILREEPARLDIAPAMQRIVATCLAKDPDERFQNAFDLKRDLQWALDWQPRAAQQPKRYYLLALVSLIALMCVGVSVIARHWQPTQAPHYTVSRLTYDDGLTTDPAITVDGKLIAFSSDRAGQDNLDIWIRQTGGGPAIQITRDPADESEPAFSPDGTTIAFRSEREGGGLWAVAALGGQPRLLAREGHNPRFSPDGAHIAYSTVKVRSAFVGSGALFMIPASGGEARPLARHFSAAASPLWLTDRLLIFPGTERESEPNRWWSLDLTDLSTRDTGIGQVMRDTGSFGVIATWNSSTSELVWVPQGENADLWTLKVDSRTAKPEGEPTRLTFGPGTESSVSATGDGAMVMATADLANDVWSLPLRGSLSAEPARLTFDQSPKLWPQISPDGKLLLFTSFRNGNEDVFVRTLGSGDEIAVTASPGPEVHPSFTASGTRVTFVKDRQSDGWRVFSVPAGGGRPELVCDKVNRFDHVTEDGRYVIYHGRPRESVWVFDRQTQTRANIVVAPAANVFQPRVSLDGRWISFLVKTDDTNSRIYAAPFRGAKPIPEAEWIPLTDGKMGDDKPRLTRDCGQLLFTSERDGFRCIWRQEVDPSTMRIRGEPVPVRHFHSARRSLRSVPSNWQEISLAENRVVFNMAEVTGNLWQITPAPK